MNGFFGRHIANTVDAVALLLIGAGLLAVYLVWGYDGRSFLLGFLVIRVFANGYSADKHFNAYLDVKYGIPLRAEMLRLRTETMRRKKEEGAA